MKKLFKVQFSSWPVLYIVAKDHGEAASKGLKFCEKRKQEAPEGSYIPIIKVTTVELIEYEVVW